jgi:hypothetical protein
MSSVVLSTLHHVTDRKLLKLAEQIDLFNVHRAAILSAAAAAPTKVARVEALLDGCTKHGIPMERSGMSVANVKRYLAQAARDPSVSGALLDEWAGMLEHDVAIQGLKYEYAALFGRLVTEWIQNPNEAVQQLERLTGSASASDSDSESQSGAFEFVARKEMHEQRQVWESYAFTELKRDKESIDKYLKDLFSYSEQNEKLIDTPLKLLQTKMAKFEEASDLRFDAEIVKSCIKGVLREDLFAGEKRQALEDLQNRPTVLKEMADVLNIDLDGLENWAWSPSPVRLVMRRHLNGKYRVYYDEEIHQAILLHFIGASWAAHMKRAFCEFYDAEPWTNPPPHTLTRGDRERRRLFLGERPDDVTHSVFEKRKSMYREHFFMTQLPASLKAGIRDYDTSGTAQYQNAGEISPLEVKELMHRLATTEMILNTQLYGEFTILQSDFKWWGPSMPHDTVYAVLRFLGVKDKWLAFFRRFMETPVAWTHDGAAAAARTRSRGMPMSHVLSDALGEAVLFCLDRCVARRTGGAFLYRFHDDIWFWGREAKCAAAWGALKEFSAVMGLELNEDKTGCAQTFRDPAARRASGAPEGLPAGEVRFGFLRLDARTARWVLDPAKIDEHIAELARQLEACRSVMAWVQAWNSYVFRFLATNMGKPAVCFGREHVDMMIDAFARIQRGLFARLTSSTSDDEEEAPVLDAAEYLRRQIRARFPAAALDDEALPAGFFYFPTELGGLELRNPFVPLFAARDALPKRPVDRIKRAREEDDKAYEERRKAFRAGEGATVADALRLARRRSARARAGEDEDEMDYYASSDESDDGAGDRSDESEDDADVAPSGSVAFMPRREHARFAEQTSTALRDAFDDLLADPNPHKLARTPATTAAFDALTLKDVGGATSTDGFYINWNDLDVYWQWIFGLHAREMVARFGGLGVGERTHLPVGLVETLRSERTRWLG